MAVLIDKTFIVNKDTTNFSNNTIIKKGTIVQGKISGTMPNGDIRITTNNGEIINYIDLQEQSNNGNEIKIGQAPNKYANEIAEDKFWRSLGFTYSDMIRPSTKGRFYLVVALVIGYFAYKKYKKM